MGAIHRLVVVVGAAIFVMSAPSALGNVFPWSKKAPAEPPAKEAASGKKGIDKKATPPPKKVTAPKATPAPKTASATAKATPKPTPTPKPKPTPEPKTDKTKSNEASVKDAKGKESSKGKINGGAASKEKDKENVEAVKNAKEKTLAKATPTPVPTPIPTPNYAAIAAAREAAKKYTTRQLIVSVPDQRMVLICDAQVVAKYKISTSRFGVGDKPGSYFTPLGRLAIADKVGSNRVEGTVFRGRNATSEVLPPNAPGRDPIVTRILHLRGLEAGNQNAYHRGIYIHGTPVEKSLGSPESYGCIRMRSVDVVELFEFVEEGTTVDIVNDRLTRSSAYYAAMHPPTPAPVLVAATGAAPTAATVPPPASSAVASPQGKPSSFAPPPPTPTPLRLSGRPAAGSRPLNVPAVDALGGLPTDALQRSEPGGGVKVGGFSF